MPKTINIVLFQSINIKLSVYAEKIVGKPEKIEYTDRTVALVEYRDGTLIDEIKQIKD